MMDKNIAKKDSVIAIIVLFLLLFFLFKSKIWVYAAFLVSVISILSPVASQFLHTIWISLTEFIGKINAWIILSVIFFLLVIPISIIKKLFGKYDVLLKRREIKTTFQLRDQTYTHGDFENPW